MAKVIYSLLVPSWPLAQNQRIWLSGKHFGTNSYSFDAPRAEFDLT